MPPVSQAKIALGVATTSQALISFMVAIAPVIAAAMAPAIGLSPERVGVFNAMCYFSAMIVGVLVSPWIAWWGPVRGTQYMLILAAIGGGLASLGGATTLIAAAFVIGASMAIPNPALSAILGKHAPADSLGLYISLRQAAAPVGVAVASLLIPLSVVAVGWRETIWLASVACAAGALGVGRTVRRLDWRGSRRPQLGEAMGALQTVVERPALRRLALVSLAYCMVQQGFLGYSVLLLVSRGVPLATAAGLLAISQLASVLSRIVMGHAADRGLSPRRLLAADGIAMAVSCFALAWLPAAAPILLVVLIMAVNGITTMGWLSLLYGQLIRIIPLDELGRCSSGIQVYTFGGAMLGPFLMAILLEHGAPYTVTFTLLGVLGAVAGISLLGHAPSIDAEQARAGRLPH